MTIAFAVYAVYRTTLTGSANNGKTTSGNGVTVVRSN